MNGPKNAAPTAPQDIPKMVTMVDGFKNANSTDNSTNTPLNRRISAVNFASLTLGLIKPEYTSLAIDELEINTNAAKVDMEAARINSNINTDSISGITCTSNSGIKASNIGFPSLKAFGVLLDDKKNRVVDPVK